MIEQLETRQLRSAGATLSGSVLTVVGTDKSDMITFAAGRKAFQVFLNGVEHAYATSAVRLIRVYGNAGNDTIILSPRLGIRASIEGGRGNDLIGAGAGDDTILGQAGDDTLVGNGGNDYLDGGAGDDTLSDNLGENVFHGGGGSDVLTVSSVGLNSGIEQGASSSIFRDSNGRIIFRFSGHITTTDTYTLSGPDARSDGVHEITFQYQYEPATGLPSSFTEDRDISDAHDSGSGLLFTRLSDGVYRSETTTVPLFLPVRR